MTFKRTLLAVVVALGAVAMMSESSHARLFRGSHGSWVAWGSHGSWGSQGSWGSHGSWGGWGSRGTWGSHGSRGTWGSHGSFGSHGTWGSHGSWGGTYGGGYAVAPVEEYARRDIVRRPRIVASRPQRNAVVAAAAPAIAAPAARTRLTLHVPSDAKVTLAGVDTKQTGEVRQFATTRLTAGQVWDDYQVVIELERDGQVLREERTIRLTGGESQELSVNFDSAQVAQR